MGQKVNPIGYRLGVNKDWDSKWYAKKNDFGKVLNNDIKIRKYLEENHKDAAIASVVIERKKKRTEVTIYSAKPGVIIGRGGEDIDKLRKALSKVAGEDVYVSITDVSKNADLCAKLVAETIAMQIENRAPFRSAQKRAIRNTMKAGTVPLHTIRADIDYAQAEANTTYGKIGVKVWIYKGEILPTKKNVKESDSHVDAKKN